MRFVLISLMEEIKYLTKIKFFITDADIKEVISQLLERKLIGKQITVNDGIAVICHIISINNFKAGKIDAFSGQVEFDVACSIDVFKPSKGLLYTGTISKIVSDCVFVKVNEWFEILIIIKTNKYIVDQSLNNVKLLGYKFIEKTKIFVGNGQLSE